MARPAYPSISSGLEAWDADVNTALAILNGPVPIPQESSSSALQTNFPATSFDRCLASFFRASSGNWTGAYLPAISDGTWKPIALQSAFQADSAAGSLAALVTDFNALLAKLRTAGTMAPA